MGKKVIVVNPYNSKTILDKRILKLSLQRKYYNSIKFMVHMTSLRVKRQMMLSQIASVNPYLCAQIIMTICEDTNSEESFLLETIVKRLGNGKSNSKNNFKRMLLMMALVELGENEIFEDFLLRDIDTLDAQTIIFYCNNFNTQQQLVLLRALLKGGTKRFSGTIIQNIERGYNNENDGAVIALAKKLVACDEILLAYRLLRAARMDRMMSKVLDMRCDELENKLLERVPFSNSDEMELYLNIKYGISIKELNDKSIWDKILLSDNIEMYGSALRSLLKKCIKMEILSNDTILWILELKGMNKMGIDENRAAKCLLKMLSKESLYVEPFYSLMPNETEMIALLNSADFENKYAFSENNRLSIDASFNVEGMNDVYEYFKSCVSRYNSAENLVRVYFNSPLRMVVNIEYLLRALKERFWCDEKRIRYLLRNYIFKGKVCRVNEKSVSIRPYNIWTTKACRLNTEKYWIVDGEKKHILKEGDILYFKFNYIVSDTEKINVHFPALSLEKMHEIEERRGAKYD